jgi:Uri superfamily endonuclease
MASDLAIQRISALGRGTYALILRLSDVHTIRVGRLGTFTFPQGWYAYAGSALNRAGLAGRLKHHLQLAARLHWHIDYLRSAAALEQVWYVQDEARHEHRWAAALCAMPDAVLPVRRFGASDCRCPAHLAHFPDCPQVAVFNALVADDLTPGERINVLRLAG